MFDSDKQEEMDPVSTQGKRTALFSIGKWRQAEADDIRKLFLLHFG